MRGKGWPAEGGLEAARDRHLAFYLQLAEEAGPGLQGDGQVIWLARLKAEHDNLRAALEWALQSGQPEKAVCIGGQLWDYWMLHGHLSEGRRWLQQALDAASPEGQPPAERARALKGAGALAWAQGDLDAALTLLEQNLAVQRRLGDTRAIAQALSNLSVVLSTRGDYEVAETYAEEGLRVSEELQDKSLMALVVGNLADLAYFRQDNERARLYYERGLDLYRELGQKHSQAIYLHNLGHVAQRQGDYVRAERFYEEGLALYRELEGRYGIGYSLSSEGELAYLQGNFASARRLLAEAMTLFDELGQKREIALCLDQSAVLAAMEGHPARAVRLFGAAEGARDTMGAVLSATDVADYEQGLAAAHALLDAAAFERLWQEGRDMSLSQAVAYALADTD